MKFRAVPIPTPATALSAATRTGLAPLYPHQERGRATLAANNYRGYIGDDAGLGKQQPVDTKVATPRGWTDIGTLQPGDRVIGSDGMSKQVMAVYPQGIQPTYKVTFSDFSSVETGLEHLWTMYYRRGGRKLQEITVTTRQLLEKGRLTTTLPNGNKVDIDLSTTILYLPMLSGPIQYDAVESRTLPLPPYTVGMLLSNGYTTGDTATVTVNSADKDEIIGRIKAEGIDLGAIRNTSQNATNIVLRKTIQSCRSLRMDIESGGKSIPEIYKTAPPDDRIALLHGLMDGDGSISKTRNKVVYYTTSSRLAKDVRSLVLGLGGIASVRSYNREHEGKPIEYQVRIRLPEWVAPFSTKRKLSRYDPGKNALPCRTLKSVEYIREVESVCIKVDAADALYVTEDCILTHNTRTAIESLLDIRDGCPLPLRVLVIAPPSALATAWVPEFERYGLNLLERIFPHRLSLPPRDGEDDSVTLTNLEQLPKLLALKPRPYDVVVVDEVQKFFNPQLARVRDLRRVTAKSPHVIVLSGSVIRKSAADLWVPLNILDRKAFPSYWRFVEQWCHIAPNPYSQNPNAIELLGVKNPKRLRRLLRPYLTRHKKRDVLSDLPPKIRQPLYVDMTGEQRRLYNAMVRDMMVEIGNTDVDADIARYVLAPNHLARTTRLRQILVTPALIGGSHESAGITAVAQSADLDFDAGQPVIIFTPFREALDHIERALRLKADATQVLKLHGGISTEGRGKIVADFQEASSPRRALLCTIDVATSFTATAAKVAYFLGYDFIMEDNIQAEDRIYRIGQDRGIVIHYVVNRNTYDEHVIDILEGRLSWNAAIFNDTEKFLFGDRS